MALTIANLLNDMSRVKRITRDEGMGVNAGSILVFLLAGRQFSP